MPDGVIIIIVKFGIFPGKRQEMLKGVTRRIVEVKSPGNPSVERAVLYLRPEAPAPKKSEVSAMAEDYLDGIYLKDGQGTAKGLKLTVAVLALSLGAALTALTVLLFLYTKM